MRHFHFFKKMKKQAFKIEKIFILKNKKASNLLKILAFLREYYIISKYKREV